jgi:hypothetical protein
MDCSVNVATSLAGILDGVIVEEKLESEAKAHGLALLLDARDKSQSWCFQTYQRHFNRRMLCAQDPRKPHVRDLAIAQKAFAMYGNGDLPRKAMEWLEPLSPILGWNGGDEFETTDLSTRFAHIQTATDWCMNLPVLMAGSGNETFPLNRPLDPAKIQWEDQRSGVSFVGTDGDNVQWFQGNFFHGSASYWANPNRGRMPYGWSCCFAQLAQLCPAAIEYALETRSTNDAFVEWGGGYYFPDHFGSLRTNRWELLAEHARRTSAWMRRTGNNIIGFNVARFDSSDARKAYEVFAREADSLLSILVFQYDRYEAGAGKVLWVKDRRGSSVPVISARYAVWENLNHRERAGTPAKISREIRQAAEKSARADLPRYDWAINHVWSYFQRASGPDENAENMDQGRAPGAGGERGYTPALWCAERLPSTIRVITPEELAWRIRMKHDPAQTRKILESYSRSQP